MNKNQFLKSLSKGLSKLVKTERDKYINDYDEIISDMVENGMTEEEAVEKQGNIEEIIKNIIDDTDKSLFVKKDVIGIILTVLVVIAFIISVVCMIALPEAGAISFMNSDGPTSVFVAGKINEPFWLYILTVILFIISNIYFAYKRKFKHMIAIIILLVCFGVIYFIREDISEASDNEATTEEITDENWTELISEEIINLVSIDDYETLHDEYCADEMKPYMTKEYMQEAKNYLCEDWGELESIGNMFTQEVVQNGQNITVVQIKTMYENTGVMYTIMYDDNRMVVGLYMM